jgi:hypothetical protein
MELINILVCFLMVPENPHLAEFRLAAGERTHELAILFLFVGCEVVRQVLGHLETFCAIRIVALIESNR